MPRYALIIRWCRGLEVMKSQSGHIRVPKAAELVADKLRRRIVRGELKEGDKLPAESTLIEALGVSRPTMREAFRILEVESLITVSRGARGGAMVHMPRPNVIARFAGHYLQSRNTTLRDVHEARMIIEPQAVYLMAKNQPGTIIEEVGALMDAAEAEIDDSEAYSHYTAQLHLKLIEGSGNETLTLIAHVINLILDAQLVRATGQQYDVKLAWKGLKSYRKALALIEAGEAEEVREHIRLHIKCTSDILLKGSASESIVELIT